MEVNLYTVVTNDKYEFPVKSDMRVAEVAKFLGVAKSTVRNMVFKPRKKSKYKVVVTGKVEYDHKEYLRKYFKTHDRAEYKRQYYLKRKQESEVME